MQDGPRPAALARVPPNNLRAEESVLGAMLLSREAIAEVVELLEPDHFYKPAHGHLYDAILSLYSGGEPVDAVTVADELKRAGLLDEIGGQAVLLDFQATTPAISNAAHYAKIVEEHALLRRMINVSNEIAETAYGVPEDVVQAVDDAEAKMFDVAQRRVANTMAPIKDLLPANLDRIEMLYDRGEAIVGLSTGYLDLDEKLAGLQPSALYVVGARPAMGKALAVETPLPTPSGWTTMGATAVGDVIFDEAGRPTTVTYKSPLFTDHDCFEVEFDDGSIIVADAEHQWLTVSDDDMYGNDMYGNDKDNNDVDGRDRPTGTCRTTRQIAASAPPVHGDTPVHRVVVAGPLDCPPAELETEPYELGVLLATRQGPKRGSEPAPNHIPNDYLRASCEQRRALLRGLMAEAGNVTAGRSTMCELDLPTEQLAAQARELVLSLGYTATTLREPIDNLCNAGWRFDFVAACGDRWRSIVAVRQIAPTPTQCITVDAPSHLYLAGREMIPTHNTAFALGLAANSAMKDARPVLIFTLEMSQLELSQRLLCSEALVDAGRVKTGRLEEGEWSRITHAVGRLAEAPIYIDDNPHTSVMDIRAKARRLKSRAGDLGMVVVDYIQLMTGRSTAESRQVEVSEISRNLKILARELDAPVVALAQLNRGLEQRTDKRPMLSDLRESGCVVGSTRVLRADGTEVAIGELLLSQETPDVWAVDDSGRVVTRRLERTFPSGIKPVFRMTMSSGREIDATGNHRFLTIDGWKPLSDLSQDDLLATPRELPEPTDCTEWPEAEVVLLAHLLGDGSVVNAVKYASIDEANIEAVFDAVRHFGCEASFEGAGTAKRTGAVQVWVPSPTRVTHGKPHPIRDWLEPLGVWGKRSHEKTIPEEVHRLNTKQVSLFLHHLWATDGSLTLSRNSRDRFVRCYYATTSRSMALGVQRLLQRFEIRSTVGITKKARCRPGYQVSIEGQPDLLRFLTEIGCHGDRGRLVPEAVEILNSIKPNPNADEIIGVATSDIFWDEVIAITPVGDQPVFDATVADVHNFIANGIVAHNSLEQDADVVLFLYRDEVYDEASPDKGVAEVIIAKHRNGPTGKARLAFRGQYTRFDNMARSVPPGGGRSQSNGGPSDEF